MLPSLLPLAIITLIFGGCCSNVFALESILKQEPDSGLLITLMQFIFTALSAWPSQFQADRLLFLKRPSVPFRKWATSAFMFFSVNMLNNWAFAFNISVPVHIILRSFGSVTTMSAGWIRGKKYSTIQVISVTILTLGVLVSAWADAQSRGKKLDASDIDLQSPSFEMGLLVLLAAQILSAFMGIYVQDVYAEHGNHWDENLFYSHFLSLPLFLPFHSLLREQYARLQDTPPLPFSPTALSGLPLAAQKAIATTPGAIAMLFLNSLTQLLCISGVNLLGAKTSAVTVTIVLNVRKLVSFMFSIWLFGNHLSPKMVVGAVLVFGGGALYGWESSVGIKRRNSRKRRAVEADKKARGEKEGERRARKEVNGKVG